MAGDTTAHWQAEDGSS